jgi:hypothetical protein
MMKPVGNWRLIVGWLAGSLQTAWVFAPVIALAAGATPADAGAPAGISNVRHEPVGPKPGAPVLITARLEEGVTKPVLRLQVVAPGKYIRKSDPAYERNWTELPMRDDGKEGDEKAGDGVYSVRVPAKYQQHRWLIRYRIVATDAAGKAVQGPGADEACPNFAWWCNAGFAAWTGSREPGKAPAVTYPTAFLETLQTVDLLARAEDVEKSQWDPQFHKKKQEGTVVYRGVVYDHIHYRNSGQASAHAGGKNKWVIKFSRGHHLPFVDHDGLSFGAAWDELRLNPGTHNPFIPVLRGITGLDEVLSLRAYRLAGVPSPPATWVQFRVVAGADEVSAKDQYAGDLWGPYVALGGMSPKLLADRKLPDGLTASVQVGIKHTPKGMEDAKKVWEKFLHDMRTAPNDEQWWRKNLDLPAYYSFHAMNRLLGNVDLRPDGNHGYYRRPDGRWAPIPWDVDMMFIPRPNQPGHIDVIACLKQPAIALEYRNRAREMLDLFAADGAERGGQIGQLTADLGVALTPKGFDVDWPRLDEARWNFHPKMAMKGVYFANPYKAQHGGAWTRTLATADFAGFRKYIVDFCTDTRPDKKYAPNDGDQRGAGWGYLNLEAKDEKIPDTPKVTRPGDKFRFEASTFASPADHKPAALEWRVGRVGKRGWYELHEYWRTEVKSDRAVDIPAEVFKAPGDYRIRARWRDHTGRCGHWSAAVSVSVR